MARSDSAAPVVNLSFNRAVKVYESYGNRYVLNGYMVTDEDMQDHVCFCIVGGKPTLIAIDISYREDSGYAPVEEPLPDSILCKYFKYNADTRSHKRSDKAIPTDVTCQEIREHLYTHDFDIDVCGNYQVLFGNAYEFLVALTDESYEPTFSYSLEDGQVCTTAFAMVRYAESSGAISTSRKER